MVYVKCIALGGFATTDATGVISAKAGDILDIPIQTAERLITQGLVKKYHPVKQEDKEE